MPPLTVLQILQAHLHFLTIHITRNFVEQSRMIEKYREFLKEKSRIKDGKHTADNNVAEEIELKMFPLPIRETVNQR